MLGTRIRHIRETMRLTRPELAIGAGMPESELAMIECNNITTLPVSQLLDIAGALKLRKAQDFARLMKLNGRKRQIHVFVTGLPKTGTVSMTGIFGNFATRHEFMQWDTHQTVIGYIHGSVNRDEFRAFIRERDDLGAMEVDAAHFNRHYIDISSEDYPEAKFICLIRDPFSWVSSLINYFVVPQREALHSASLPNGMPFDVPRGDMEAKRRLVEEFSENAETPISFWAEEYRRMLSLLPHDRSLILRTHEISSSLQKIADFVGIDYGLLRRDRTHLNKAPYTTDVLRQCDPDHLEALFNKHCGDLLDRFFPDYGLDDYFNGKKPE